MNTSRLNLPIPTTTDSPTVRLNMPQQIRHIMSDPELSPTEARFAYHVLDSAGYGAGACTKSLRTLAALVGIKERQARTVMLRLQSLGYVIIEHATGSKHSELVMLPGPRCLYGPKNGLHLVDVEPCTSSAVECRPNASMRSAVDGAPGRQSVMHLVGSGVPTNGINTTAKETPSSSNSRTREGPHTRGTTDDDGKISLASREEEKPQEAPPAIPPEVLAVIGREMGTEAAEEVQRAPGQFSGACGGQWDCLAGAARYVGRQIRKGGVTSPVGLLDRKAREYAAAGVPVAFRPPPPPPTAEEKARAEAMNEGRIRETTRSVIGQARLSGVDWPEILRDIETRMGAREAELQLSDSQTQQRRAWALAEVDQARVAEASRREREEKIARYQAWKPIVQQAGGLAARGSSRCV